MLAAGLQRVCEACMSRQQWYAYVILAVAILSLTKGTDSLLSRTFRLGERLAHLSNTSHSPICLLSYPVKGLLAVCLRLAGRKCRKCLEDLLLGVAAVRIMRRSSRIRFRQTGLWASLRSPSRRKSA